MEERNPEGRAGAGRRLLSVLSRKWHGSGPLAAIFRNMALLTSGAMLARVVAAGSAPFITRIYTPEHMGVLSVFASLAAMLIPFVTLAYSTAIPLPKRDGMALNLAVLCGALLLTISPLVLVFFLLFSEPVPHGSGVGPCSQLSAMARIFAVLVLPVPRGPAKR